MSEAAVDEGRLVAGRYRLLERIGQGGMGTVWRAQDEMLGRQVAMKRLHASVQLQPDELATRNERTRREARAAARINHANVVGVHDVVDDGGLPCIIMEYVPSVTLGDVIKDAALSGASLPPEEAARIGRGMIAALRAAHAAGVLHRDVKPGNVLLGDDGRVVLTDFGIAVASGTSTLTKTGELVGSIDYLAPERVKGGTPGPASDLWALGATLYQAVEGRPPFRKNTAVETAYAIAMDPLRPPENAGVLAPLIEALLAKEPADRPTADVVEQALRAPASEAATELLAMGSGSGAYPPAASGPAGAGTATPTGTDGGGAAGGGAVGAPTGSTDATGTAGTTGTARPTGTTDSVPVQSTGAHDTDSGRTTSPPYTNPHVAPHANPYATPPPNPYATPQVSPYATPQPPAAHGAAASDQGTLATTGGLATTDGRPRSKRRTARRVLLAGLGVVAAGLIAAGVLYVLQQEGGSQEAQGATPSGAASPSASATELPPVEVPEGYHLVKEKALGVSFPVPDGWTRLSRDGGRQIDYIDPTGLVDIKINVLDFASSDQVQHFKDVEADFQAKEPSYQRLRLQDTLFQGDPAAIWEFTFDGRVRTFRGIDLGFGREGGNEYAIYLTAPEAQWTKYEKVFTNVKDGFRRDDEG